MLVRMGSLDATPAKQWSLCEIKQIYEKWTECQSRWGSYRADPSSEKWDGSRLVIGRSGFGSPISFRGHDTIDDRHVDSSLLPNGAVLQDSADAAPTPWSGPDVLLEFTRFIDCLNGLAHTILCVPYHLLEARSDVSTFRFPEKCLGPLGLWSFLLDRNGSSNHEGLLIRGCMEFET